jgi:phospholipid transport system substrate-binding protein
MLKTLSTSLLVAVLVLGCRAIAQSSPAGLVESTTKQLLSALRQDREALQRDPTRLHALVDEIATPHFDVDFFARYVLGRTWRGTSPEQRRRFTQVFRRFVVDSYASALLQYSDQTVKVYPAPAPAKGARMVAVRTEVTRPSGPPLSIDYRLCRRRGEWKVCDVVIEHVSMIINYRASFADEIRAKGLNGLIEELERHSTRQVR